MEGKYSCCCGPCTTHIEKGALVIATIGAILSLINFISAFFTTAPYAAVGHAIAILLYLSIIFAQRKANHKLYLPYLIIMAISMVLTIVAILICAFSGEMFGIAIVLFIGLILNGYFYSVIFRAYKFLKEENSSRAGMNQQKA